MTEALTAEDVRLKLINLIQHYATLDYSGLYYGEAEQELMGHIENTITEYGEAVAHES